MNLNELGYKQIMYSSPNAVVITDMKGKILDCNQASLKLHGFSNKKDILGFDAHKFLAPQSIESATKYINSIIDKKANKPQEFNLLTKNKKKFIGEISASVLRDKKKKPAAIAIITKDITDRKKMEEELKNTNLKLKITIKAANISFYSHDLKTGKVFRDENIKKIYGYKKEEMDPSHKWWRSKLHPEDKAKTIAELEKHIAGRIPIFKAEFRLLAKQGWKWIYSIGKVITTKENGQVTKKLNGFLYDIDDRKKAEIALKENEAKYKSLVEKAKNGIVIVQNNILQYVNQATSKMFGCQNPKEMIGHIFTKYVAPESRDMMLKKAKLRIAGKKLPNTYSFKALRSDGTPFDTELTVAAITYHGRPALQGIVRDITIKKSLQDKITQDKKHFEQVIDTIKDSIFVVDESFIIKSFNLSFAKQINLPPSKIKNKKCSQIMPLYEKGLFKNTCNKKNHLNCSITNALKKNKEIITEKTNIDKDGNTHYHEIIARPIKSNKNKKKQVVVSIRDITNRRQAEEKVEKLNKELENKVNERTKQLDNAIKKINQALNLKSKFISDASHELRTPLTILRGNLDLIIRDRKKNKKNIPANLIAIKKEVRKMARILSDLTLLTNADANTEKLDHEQVDLNSLLKTVSESLKILAKQKNIKIKYEKRAEKINIMGDENKLEKLFLNLVRNSIKYGRQNGFVKIWTKKETDIVKIYIQDNGMGISEQELPFIFERFYRVDKARSRSEDGTGIGLSISKWIAEAYKGKIDVESKLGKGSTFIVNLPINCKKKSPYRLF